MKKTLALLLIVVCVLSLCACGNKKSDKGSSNFTGTWKMESVTGGEASMPEGTDSTLTLNQDGSFEMKVGMSQSGISMDESVTGSYTTSGNDISLKSEKVKISFMGQSSESTVEEDNEKLKGTLENGKLVLKNEKKGTTMTFVK